MFRVLLVAVGISLLFGGALYASGDYLEAWVSPNSSSRSQAPANTAPRKAVKKRARAKPAAPRRRPGRRRINRKPAWVVDLNTLCRRSLAEVTAIPQPQSAEETTAYFRRIAGMGKRWNRQAAAVLTRGAGPDPAAVRRLLRLFPRDEILMEAMTSAVERRQVARLRRLAPALLALAKSEERILVRLGASDCALGSEMYGLS